MIGNAPAISAVIATAPRRNRQRISKSRATSLVAFALVLLTLASGCATRSKMPASGLDWDQRETELTQLTVWQAHGRIAVKSDDGGGQGQLHWYQTDAGAQIQLSGPFGVGAYELAWGRDSLVVTTKAGEVTAAYAGPEAAEQFLMDQMGWSFSRIPGVRFERFTESVEDRVRRASGALGREASRVPIVGNRGVRFAGMESAGIKKKRFLFKR